MSTEDQPQGLEPSQWYTTEEVAAALKVDPSSMMRWRTARPPQGPAFVAFSERVIRYSGADVLAFIASRRVDPRAP